MAKWLRKSVVVLVTIFTFGLVTPSQAFLYDHSNSEKSPKKDLFAQGEENKTTIEESAIHHEPTYDSKEQFVQRMIRDAEVLSYSKFGSKIKSVIEDEFTSCILPNIERAIAAVAEQHPEEELDFLTISEKPGGGNSEKIFNIANAKANEDIIRFHVRKDHPPQQGYWFNFHYHTHHDGFITHHELGSIYWDKNTPPKWMS